MNGFGIFVKNTLLDKKHHENMGKAVWLYMWLLDKMTSVSEDGVGKVLGGKPIKAEDFAYDLQLSKKTYFRYLETLREHGYISTVQTPYGLSILVHKAAKPSVQKTVDKSKREFPKVSTHNPKSVHSLPKSVHSNKTIQLDNTEDIKKLNKEKLKKAVDNRGEYSPTKEKIREALKAGRIKQFATNGG